MDSEFTPYLSQLGKTREIFTQWYTINVGSQESMIEFLNLPTYTQVGLFLAFLGAQNVTIDIKMTDAVNGYNIRIIDSALFPEEQKSVSHLVYYMIDGDYYLHLRDHVEGKALSLYVQGIKDALFYLNTTKTTTHEFVCI